jgi:single-strand selective monofunctional uracil DNA glycosylase
MGPAVSLTRISRRLSEAVDRVDSTGAAAYVYNPLAYARRPHEAYLERYGQGPKRAVLLGMNPGPFGMAQTGVPFGDVPLVRDFLGIDQKVGKPPLEHPKRPIEGFACTKREVSGSRLWGWAAERFETAARFHKSFFVVNYCPLVFMTATGSNLTPDKLPRGVLGALEEVCDEALRAICDELEPEWVIGVGAYARKQAERALSGSTVKVGSILHPSPASPAANRGWAPQAEKELTALGLDLWNAPRRSKSG